MKPKYKFSCHIPLGGLNKIDFVSLNMSSPTVSNFKDRSKTIEPRHDKTYLKNILIIKS